MHTVISVSGLLFIKGTWGISHMKELQKKTRRGQKTEKRETE